MATTPELSSKSLKSVRQQLHDAAIFVRSREVTQVIQGMSFDDFIADAIREMVGDDTQTLRETIEVFDGSKDVQIPVRKVKMDGRMVMTKMDQINAMENTLAGIVEKIKSIDPKVMEELVNNEARDVSERT